MNREQFTSGVLSWLPNGIKSSWCFHNWIWHLGTASTVSIYVFSAVSTFFGISTVFYTFMDRAENQRSIPKSVGKFITTSRYKNMTSNFNQLHRTTLPPFEILWTLMCSSKVQFFLWKALIEGLSTFDTNILPSMQLRSEDCYHAPIS
ncbi:uncharacterized protein LOC113355784 isoform X1 [Papaver somniferum]|uniref:uncharacterized protein LOC113355784 isoform X1 n=1 Tax=Papaver somniferum TaxID=3469 RepID=UPI000E7054F7|nr:uncharacterized protein LOC113355784 isoform X1 [Papaver somniferum]